MRVNIVPLKRTIRNVWQNEVRLLKYIVADIRIDSTESKVISQNALMFSIFLYLEMKNEIVIMIIAKMKEVGQLVKDK